MFAKLVCDFKKPNSVLCGKGYTALTSAHNPHTALLPTGFK